MISPTHIVPIVEGHGEVRAVPILLRRICEAIAPGHTVEVPNPLRVKRDKVVKPGELDRYLGLAARKAGEGGAVLLLLDADDDCPAELAPTLVAAAQGQRSDLRVAVVLANREFEAWFLASATSLRGHRGLPSDLAGPPDAEAVRDAKGWLQGHRTDRFSYSPTADQAALAAIMDIDEARHGSLSFDKLCREIERLLGEGG